MSNHIHDIAMALEHAKRKHPFFASTPFNTASAKAAQDHLKQARYALMDPMPDGVSLLACEVAEAAAEYAKQDYAACLEELAQCAAVIIRMMEMVAKEKLPLSRVLSGERKPGKELAKKLARMGVKLPTPTPTNP